MREDARERHASVYVFRLRMPRCVCRTFSPPVTGEQADVQISRPQTKRDKREEVRLVHTHTYRNTKKFKAIYIPHHLPFLGFHESLVNQTPQFSRYL